MILIAWQDHNETVKEEEMQRQQVIAAEQARTQAEQERIKAEQESDAFIEEYKREKRKKRIHDMVYGRDHGYNSYDRSFGRGTLNDSMTRMEMENIARDEAKRAIRKDRLMPAP